MEKRQSSLRYKTHTTATRKIKVPARRIDGVYERPVKADTKKPQVVVQEKASEINPVTTRKRDGKGPAKAGKTASTQNQSYQTQQIHRGSHIVHRVIHEYYTPTNSQPVPVVHQQYMPRPVQVQHPTQKPVNRPVQQNYPLVLGEMPTAPMRQTQAQTQTQTQARPPAPVRMQQPKPPAKPEGKVKSALRRLGPKDGKVRPTDIVRYAVVTFFVVMAGYLAYDTWETNQQVQNAVNGNSASASYDSSADVSNPPVSNGEAYPEYKVAADQPRIIMISSINVTARIMSVGLTSGSKIDVPSDSSFAGYYTGASVPGDKGAAFITGHYNGPNAGGVFDNLGNLAVGAEVKIEMGDGSIKKYEVVSTETVPVGQVDMAKALSVVNNEDEGLNIMTCAGSFTGSGFADRLTVYTKRV